MGKTKVFFPKKLAVDAKALVRAVKNGMDGAARGAHVDFQVTTKTWDTNVAFDIQAPDPFTRIVGTDNQIYDWVDKGTKPHIIRPRRSKVLAFQGPYRAKTRKGYIGSDQGSIGRTQTVTKIVHHPGTKARELSEAIAEKWQDELPKTVQRAIDAEVRRMK